MLFRKKLHRRRSLIVPAPAVLIRRARALDISYTYRMPAGFAGDVNRTHPATIEAASLDPTNPPTFYGQAVVLDAGSHKIRTVLAADQAGSVDIYGITVRPFPFQDSGLAAAFGGTNVGVGALPTGRPVDVLRSGYIMVPINGAPNKGGAVNVWAAASAAPHVQGAFEAAATGGSTFPITGNDKTTFQGGIDANGIGEVAFNV